MDLKDLQEQVQDCTACKLCQTRAQVVFGIGPKNPVLMLVGEAPGADEDRSGFPFVGKAGQFLDRLLHHAGVNRNSCYITNMVKCIRYNSLVQLGDGTWERIGRLVRDRYDGDVMSINDQGEIVPRKVIGWYETPLGDRRVFKVGYAHLRKSGKHSGGTHMTGDHPVLTERGWQNASCLVPGDRIATGQGLSDVAIDVVCGTLLGDGSIHRRDSYLSFNHSAKQKEYALAKAGWLSELSPQWKDYIVRAAHADYPSIRVRTISHRALPLIRDDFYKPNKRVPAWLPDRINARMLAVWFMDDGHMRIRPSRSPLAEIATNGFPEEDSGVLIASFSKMGMQVKYSRRRIHFGADATRVLSYTIAPYVPPPMRYKLPPDVRDSDPFEPCRFQPGPKNVFYDDVVVEDVTDHRRTDTTFFCLDVDSNHNFVTTGGVVHNCRPPGNRDPEPCELKACRGWLDKQIDLVNPSNIVTVGRISTQQLTTCFGSMGDLVERQDLTYTSMLGRVITVSPLWHPSYLLRLGTSERAKQIAKECVEVLKGADVL